MATTRREIQEQEPVVEDVPIYTEEEQLAPEEFINPFGPDEFNYRRALSDGYNLSEINQFLAAEQGFDIEQAYRDVQRRRNCRVFKLGQNHTIRRSNCSWCRRRGCGEVLVRMKTQSA